MLKAREIWFDEISEAYAKRYTVKEAEREHFESQSIKILDSLSDIIANGLQREFSVNSFQGIETTRERKNISNFLTVRCEYAESIMKAAPKNKLYEAGIKVCFADWKGHAGFHAHFAFEMPVIEGVKLIKTSLVQDIEEALQIINIEAFHNNHRFYFLSVHRILFDESCFNKHELYEIVAKLPKQFKVAQQILTGSLGNLNSPSL